jgi:methionine aminopeptidase
MLSKTAEWAEAMKAITENKLSKFGKELEKALTGGASFEDMELSLKRTNSLQEEFLTTTNKIYETEKMMRTAQNAIDVSINQVAK